MNGVLEDQQLSALALLEANMRGRFQDTRNIIDNTEIHELLAGMLMVLGETMGEYAACLGLHPFEVIAVMRTELIR